MIRKYKPNMSVFIAIVSIALSQFACSLFTGEDPEHVDFVTEEVVAPEQQAPVEEEGEVVVTSEEFYFEQDGIKLYYNPQLILDVEPPAESISASNGEEMYGMPHPAYVHFDLSMEQAQVYIAPVQEYESIADFAPGIIADLQRLNEGMSNFDGCVPELPLNKFFHVCGHQQFNANASRLNFQNGTGSRFVTVYGIQDMAPVGNENLFYIFQGFTDDNKYYIKIVVRISNSQLPQTGEIPNEVYAAMDYSVVEQYFDGFEKLLNQNEADYAPKLDWIDAFLQSLRVE